MVGSLSTPMFFAVVAAVAGISARTAVARSRDPQRVPESDLARDAAQALTIRGPLLRAKDGLAETVRRQLRLPFTAEALRPLAARGFR